MNSRANLRRLRSAWEQPRAAPTADFMLIENVGRGYAARSRTGAAALVIELPTFAGRAVGRTAAGCDLTAHGELRFAFGEREWAGPAAALVSTDDELLDVFCVLAADVLERLGDDPTWSRLVSLVEEWQALLTPRAAPTPEREIGLWGELWFLASSVDLDRALAGWRGPEGDATDFFVDGTAVDMKASRTRRRHHVSRAQVEEPVGTNEAWFLSAWVKTGSQGDASVSDLALHIRERASDAPDATRRLARAGYSFTQRQLFATPLVLLDEPEWYAARDVPRVHGVDPGVSQLRYVVTLDEANRARSDEATRLWNHFIGRGYSPIP